jgi:hypothetical protein
MQEPWAPSLVLKKRKIHVIPTKSETLVHHSFPIRAVLRWLVIVALHPRILSVQAAGLNLAWPLGL